MASDQTHQLERPEERTRVERGTHITAFEERHVVRSRPVSVHGRLRDVGSNDEPGPALLSSVPRVRSRDSSQTFTLMQSRRRRSSRPTSLRSFVVNNEQQLRYLTYGFVTRTSILSSIP